MGAVSLCNFDEEATSSSCCCWFFLGLLLLCIKDNSEACLYFFLGGSLIACLCATYLAAQIIAPTVDRNYSFRFKVTVYYWYPGLLLCLLLGRFFNITSRNNAFVTTKCSNWKEIIISCITHKISHGVSFFFFIKNKSRWSVAITNFYPVHNVWNTSHQVVLGP